MQSGGTTHTEGMGGATCVCVFMHKHIWWSVCVVHVGMQVCKEVCVSHWCVLVHNTH